MFVDDDVSRRTRGAFGRVAQALGGGDPHEHRLSLDEIVANEPYLVRISAAKRLRDRAERDARSAGEERVTVARVSRARAELTGERAA